MTAALVPDKVAEWFLHARGIRPETLEHFGITTDDKGNVVIPYGQTIKKKRRSPLAREDAGPRFQWPAATEPLLFNQEEANRRVVFATEGETDAMRLWQELRDAGVGEDTGVVAIPGIETWNETMAAALEPAKKVWVTLDNDPDYRVQPRVENLWRSIRHDLGSKARRVKLPHGYKDVCEFFAGGLTLEQYKRLLQAATEYHYPALDLALPPPPVNWLVEPWIARGHTHLLSGDPGSYKSWLTMSLAVAMAEGHTQWLGMPLTPGRVFYVDEENPEDIIYERLTKLGLTPRGSKNIRYLWGRGVRLDSGDAELLDDAIAFEPSLVVFDSLGRTSVGDENAAGEMNRLFNFGYIPFAREVNAAVVVIHHYSQKGAPRGSTAIPGAVDKVMNVIPDEGGRMSVYASKERRKGPGLVSYRVKDQGPDRTFVERLEEPF